MATDTSKRVTVVLIAVLFVCIFMIPAIAFVLTESSLFSMIVLIVALLLSSMVVYYAVERIKEIDGGMDDDVDNY